MKTVRSGRKLTLIILIIFFSMASFSLQGQSANKVYFYEKSNLDGTNLGQIAVYHQGEDQIESYKWHSGHSQATLVRAFMDGDRQTVKRFEAYRIDQEGTARLTAKLDVEDGHNILIEAGDHRQALEFNQGPWHSYDFDFASLGHAFPSLQDKTAPFSFHILDIDLKESPPVFKDFGTVEMRFIKDTVKGSRAVLQYEIDGEGLDHRGGTIWFDMAAGFLVGFEIQKPDEPGYDTGKLLLTHTLEMESADWERFKMEQLKAQ